MLTVQTERGWPQWRCGEKRTPLRDSGFLLESVPQALTHTGWGGRCASRIYDGAVYVPELCLPAAGLENRPMAFTDRGSTSTAGNCNGL